MSAASLRRVGTLGVWVDPDAVIAGARHQQHVILLVAGGGRVTVSTLERATTDADVDIVVAELQADVDDEAPDEHDEHDQHQEQQ